MDDDDRLWSAVERLAARTRIEADLQLHGLLPVAGRAQSDGGASGRLARLERSAALKAITARRVLARVRAAYDGDVILLKGLEVAQHYPAVVLRPFNDVDLLVRDAGETERALVRSGCRYVDDPDRFRGIHHGQPLAYPDLPVWIEVHHELKWPVRPAPPDPSDLWTLTAPSRTGVDGILALRPAAHALAIAAHAWAHAPLGEIRSLLDIAVLTAGGAMSEADELARRWRMTHLWRTTRGAAESLFYGSHRTIAQRVWARHLDPPRDRTLVEQHVCQCLSPLWASPLREAVPATVSLLLAELLPRRGESWTSKLARTRQAVASASSRSQDYARRSAAPR